MLKATLKNIRTFILPISKKLSFANNFKNKIIMKIRKALLVENNELVTPREYEENI